MYTFGAQAKAWRLAAVSAGLLMLAHAPAHAVIEFDQDVTNDVIFGSGNANGGFTTDRQNGIEIGLRGKLRFDANNQPQNIYNSNGNGTYSFAAGPAPIGFSFNPPGLPTTPIWSFDWSINTNYDGSTSFNLDDLFYRLEIDFDPSGATSFLAFDPINVALADHSIGDNATANGGGAEATDAADYAALIAGNNLAQQSWSYEFFNDAPFDGFDPNDRGSYIIRLSAYQDADLTMLLASTQIAILVPEPSTIALLLAGLGLLLFVRRRRASSLAF